MPEAEEILYKPKNLRITDKWRDFYNPLVGLRTRQVAQWFYDYQLGIVSNLTWLYRFIERRDPTISACISRRVSAIKKLNWGIKTISDKELPEGFTMADAEAQQKALQENYDRIDNLTAAIEWLALGQFRGYAHLEKHYNGDGDICHLEPVPQWNWARAGLTGDWYYNQGAYQIFANPDAPSPQLTEIDTKRFVIREVSHPIHEALVINYLRKSMNQKDWDAYIETYGLPPLFVIMPPDAPKFGEPGYGDYLAMVERVASDSRGAVPAGTDIKTVSGSSQSTHPFKDHIQYIDEQMVLVSTGGLLTMLARSGTGTLAGQAHKDTFDELAEAEASEISEIMSQIDLEILEEKFPLQPQLAWFALEAEEATDTTKIVDDVANLKGAGLLVDIDQIMEKTGYILTEAPDPEPDANTPPKLDKSPQEVTNRRLLSPWARISNRRSDDAGKLATNAMKRLSKAQAEQMHDMLERFRDDVMLGTEGTMRNRWNDFAEEMPAMLEEMNLNPKAAKAFKDAFSTGYIAGLFQGARKSLQSAH